MARPPNLTSMNYPDIYGQSGPQTTLRSANDLYASEECEEIQEMTSKKRKLEKPPESCVKSVYHPSGLLEIMETLQVASITSVKLSMVKRLQARTQVFKWGEGGGGGAVIRLKGPTSMHVLVYHLFHHACIYGSINSIHMYTQIIQLDTITVNERLH